MCNTHLIASRLRQVNVRGYRLSIFLHHLTTKEVLQVGRKDSQVEDIIHTTTINSQLVKSTDEVPLYLISLA